MKTLEEANKILGTDYRTWVEISCHRYLSEEFIRKFADELNWNCISQYQKLPEELIREFSDRVNWNWISQYQKLPEELIREFSDKVDWHGISIYHHLPEEFIREFKDRLNWGSISEFQHLPESFIREFKDRLRWETISKYQYLPEELIREFKDKVDTHAIEDSWLYKDTEFKKSEVIKTGLYECYDDYFIAYKGIRADRYSNFTFRYKYEAGGVYESWCDCSHNKYGFGLSVCTEDEARKFCNQLMYCYQLIVKVKVRYEDVGRVVHDGGKSGASGLRCWIRHN